MAFWGWRAAAAVRVWGRVAERAEAGGGVGPFQAWGCRLVLGGRDHVSAGPRGSRGVRGEPLDPARPLQRPPRPAVPRAFRRQPRAAAPGFFFSSIKGGRRPISLSVGASSVVGSGGDSDKGKLSLQDVAELIRARACQRVVAMVGAGISTPSGIPDFRGLGASVFSPCRSPGSGLYSNLQQYDLPYPEAIFELPFFSHNPKPFFALAKELYPGNYKPNITHYFLRLLHDKGLLLRLYTQNIDGLERVSGIPASKLVEAHGTFASATCTVCRRPFPGEDFRADVMAGRVPRCPVCTGVVKPDVVFFGEPLPQRFLLHVLDFPMADLLLILGTSLEVEPFASLTEAVRSSVPRLLINRDLVGPLAWRPRGRDVAQLGDVVHSVERLVELLGWTEEMRDLVQRETGKLNGPDK
ncbi:NAD-dependent protein deacetylase sirtuin-3, mitochondrial isoform X1 [Rhinopithecus roxellana]|uniref:NAD-dependent protein deacetylase sirtuin-3, mitochondrial isoform X1 n=2 Tax=Rhinopithecus roxellana TaxID=61622 RepID=UPI0005330A72|nr:NAD-dependent protein deacetylase sirtuin-3, mitochondrial isoform X1 [Rhinopithecus roxellana]